ncbi:threonine-phosphate decarboxylase [Paracoccus acridae]|uniref:Aminotransferase n=1 Tax=Paracoccus acridae TaxID=1795310 RepID=A0ABQ1VK71_9RHOB|nr:MULTISPECIES: threonine-phosphate decarboxylase [Paracoccus]GGF74247.1 threonine-phosphate decarboxylase [Paracoccus acridae]
MRDHGGNLDEAQARWGQGDWVDLSTGINRQPYPVSRVSPGAWTNLPTASAMAALMEAAATAFGTAAPGLAMAGAQAAVQMIPLLERPGLARVLAPTYNEHAACLRQAGWHVEEVARLEDLSGADLAVVVNPNNPDGRICRKESLLTLSVGRLVVDESFVDPDPAESLVAKASDRLLVLRSFGKFWGLAGLRLGFVYGGADVIRRMSALAGPWPVSGPALEIGRMALGDRDWRDRTVRRLSGEAERLDRLAASAGWIQAGGTLLFRLYDTPNAQQAQDALACHYIWTRRFSYSERWLRLGLPGNEGEWQRVAAALGT